MRTLIAGIAVPHFSFDNASFLSAPSFSEYGRLVVDLGAAARAAQDVVEGTTPHTTYGGQAIVNGKPSAHAFGLEDLLAMRRRETARLLEGGGLIVVFGQPEVIVPDVGDGWPSYSWLPNGEDFDWSRDLLPGFGMPGAVLTDADHPFAPIVEALASRLAYRVYLNEDGPASARVFCRSSGGVAIGFEVSVGAGHTIVLPAIEKPASDRQVISEALLRCFERWEARAQSAEWASKEVP